MEREASRSIKLPAFIAKVGDLARLEKDLREYFGSPERFRFTVSYKDEHEEVKLSVDELREAAAGDALTTRVPDFVRDFGFSVSDYEGRSVYMSVWLTTGGADVRAGGTDPAWCLGALDVVRRALAPTRAWYSLFRVNTYVTQLIFLVLVSLAVVRAVYHFWGAVMPPPVIFGLAFGAAALILHYCFDQTFPASALRVREVPSFWKRNEAEVRTAIAVATFLFTVLAPLATCSGPEKASAQDAAAEP